VAPVYRFLLMLQNGKAADPAAFLTEQLDWKRGDVFVTSNGRAFRIVYTDAEVEVAGMVLFDAIWTVEPLEEPST
jgi:leucyl aminopeptidase